MAKNPLIKPLILAFANGATQANFPPTALGLPGSSRLIGIRTMGNNSTATVDANNTANIADGDFKKAFLTIKQQSGLLIDGISLVSIYNIQINTSDNLGYYPLEMSVSEMDMSGSFVRLPAGASTNFTVTIELVYTLD